jgi:ankyrin repeat protein
MESIIDRQSAEITTGLAATQGASGWSGRLREGAGDDGCVKQHLAAGVDVNAKTWNWTTPLHNVAVYGHKEVAELLIAKGADINAKDNAVTTTLDWAKYKPELAALLRKHGGKTGEELKAEGK